MTKQLLHMTPGAPCNWLDCIPQHWLIKALKRLFRIFNGSTPSSSDPTYWDGDIPWATPDDLGELNGNALLRTTRRMLTREGYQSCGTNLVPAGSLILSTRAPIGHVAIGGLPLCTNQGCRSLVPVKDANAQFFYYVLVAARAELESWGQGSTFRELGRDRLAAIHIPVPPVEEQCNIAAFLERETFRIDALIAQKQGQIELLRERRAAFITHLVTRGLNPNVRMKDSRMEGVGEVPAHWTTMALKRTARKGHGTFTDGDWIESPYIEEQGIRLIQTGNVGVGEYIEKGFRYVSEQTFSALKCTEVFPSDVLICRLDGPVGRAVLAPDLGVRMITSVDNTILKPSPDHDPRFLVYSMSSKPWIDLISSVCRVGGGFRLRVSRTMLGDLHLALPPLSEQKEIADTLDARNRNDAALVTTIGRGIDVLREYRTALISAAVTGKIDVRREAAS